MLPQWDHLGRTVSFRGVHYQRARSNAQVFSTGYASSVCILKESSHQNLCFAAKVWCDTMSEDKRYR